MLPCRSSPSAHSSSVTVDAWRVYRRPSADPSTMPIVTFQLDAGGIGVNGAVYVVDQLSAPTGHQMSISVGSIYNTSVTLAAGSYTYKFRNGANWEALVGQSCAIKTTSGCARPLVVTSGQDSTVGPFCFGSCHTCLLPPLPPAPAVPLPAAPPPVTPRDANRGYTGRRRVERSYFPIWLVFVLGGIAFAGVAVAGAHRRRAHRRREQAKPDEIEDEDTSCNEDIGCKQLEPLDERFQALSLFQTSMVAAPAQERPLPQGRAQSASAAYPVGKLQHELGLAESQARRLPTMMLN